METNRLKRFATEARNKIKQGVADKLHTLGFDAKGEPTDFPRQLQGATLFRGQQLQEDFYDKWTALHDAIHKGGDPEKGLRLVYEEAAYTWFNRFLAIRILQKNGFIDRVLSYDNPEIRVPHIVSEARQGRYPLLSSQERSRLLAIIGDANKTYEQFSLLITSFCHNTPIIYKCFGRIADYTELLLPDDILSEGGFIDMLNHTDFITDDDYHTSELLGWLYQFYISERKAEVNAAFKKGSKAEAEDIPAATQFFTPNWIVKYMVQNTLGRICLDNNPDSRLRQKMRYLVEPSEGDVREENACHYGDLEELKVADLACGSGHILLESFDLLYDMYRAEYYSPGEAVEAIFRNNLYGVDLDTRAKQLAMFALMLKACQKDDNFLKATTLPQVLDMPKCDSYTWRENAGSFVSAYGLLINETVNKEMEAAFNLMKDADTLGSIMKFDLSEATIAFAEKAVNCYDERPQSPDRFATLIDGLRLMLMLTRQYSVIVMNPPFMGGKNMNATLSKYVKDNYPEGKADLCTVFVMCAYQHTMEKGKYAFIIPPSWLFLSRFETLRRNIIDHQTINSLLHLSRGVFGADFGSSACVISNGKADNPKGIYFRLVERTFQEFEQSHLCMLFEQTLDNHDFKYYFKDYDKDVTELPYSATGNRIYYPDVPQEDFKKIPGCPIGYWVSEKMIEVFGSNPPLSTVAKPSQGLSTADKVRFLRLWFEVATRKIGFHSASAEDARLSRMKWFPITKGGSFRRWYGNMEYVVNWENDGKELKDYAGSAIRNERFYFLQDGATWSSISSGKPSFRYFSKNWLFAGGGSVCFPENKKENIFVMGYLNSKIVFRSLEIIIPTMNFNEGPVSQVPFMRVTTQIKKPIEQLVEANISLSRQDWDAHETSWDFQENELVRLSKEGWGSITGMINGEPVMRYHSLKLLLMEYKSQWTAKFMRLHANEEDLNRQFIAIYGLEDELMPYVPLDEVTILQAGEISIEDGELKWHDDVIVKQLISYAVGCMMGRYSIDKPGLILANQGDTVERYNELVPNSRFECDDDGIVPLMPHDSPFNDNAPLRLQEFVKLVFGEERLSENLNVIESALGKSIADYFQKDFWKDHKKMYQNRPIYWLFASKKGAFQCIVYMHRMNAYTVSRLRTKYLLKEIEYLKQRIDNLRARQAELSVMERKQLAGFEKNLEECREYDIRLHAVADRQIAFDLDDGVVVNHAKFGDVVAKLK